jgi:hypothetical protein
MPLLFAIAGVVALGLSLLVLVGPVLLIVGVVSAIRAARSVKSIVPDRRPAEASASPVDGSLADAAFIDLVAREWPAEAPLLGYPST